MYASKSADNLIIFVGGPHSVGKSTVLKELRRIEEDQEIRINIVSMSDTLQKASMAQYSKSIVELNKDSRQRDELQCAIISMLRGLDFSFTLLDGHYTLTDQTGYIGRSYNTNKGCLTKFDAQIVLTAKPEMILARRIEKNQRIWPTDLESIRYEIEMEVSEAKRIGALFGTLVYVIENNDKTETAERIWKLLPTISKH